MFICTFSPKQSTYGIYKMNQITFRQYKSIDLTLICIITAIFETIATLATNKWFHLQAMAISITLTMTCIAIMRWSAYAVIPSAIGSLAFCIVSVATPIQYLIYCGGSLFSLLSLFIVKCVGKEKLRRDFVWRLIFVSFTYLSTVLGRWLISLLFEPSLMSLITFITTDILSLLFAVVVMSLLKGADGMIEDQKEYLLRIDRESKEEEVANLNDPFSK